MNQELHAQTIIRTSSRRAFGEDSLPGLPPLHREESLFAEPESVCRFNRVQSPQESDMLQP